MLNLPAAECRAEAPALGRALMQALPRTYAAIFFSSNEKLGWWLLAITLLAPDMGLAGVSGVVLAFLLGWWVGFDREQLRSGHLLFNSMLSCNTVAWLHHGHGFAPGVLVCMGVMAACASLFLSVALGSVFSKVLGLGAHSLPAVLTGYVVYFLSWSLHGPFHPAAMARGAVMDLDMLPDLPRAVCQGFGAMLFMPLALPGALILLVALLYSRLTVVAALVGFIAGFCGMKLLGFPLEPMGVLWCGFNFLFCGVALAVGYYTPSRTSLLLGALAAFLCAPVAVAVATALRYFELPASALPANMVVLALVYALRQRSVAGPLLLPNLHPGREPAVSARLRLLGSARFPYLNVPALQLPCEGERVVTQGFDGKLTHRGPWRHAVDLEAREQDAAWRGDGRRLEDFVTYGKPVLSPCEGVVVRAVSSVPDHAPGENNPDANWGNHLVIRTEGGLHVLLAHLQQGTVCVPEGHRVAVGEVVGHIGNSGRSPIPHLHVHVQESAQPGAPTRPFCLVHYLSRMEGAASWVYHTAGVPVDGETVAPCGFASRKFSMFSGWLPGEYRWRMSGDDGRTWEETLEMDFDEAGCYRVRSRRHEAGFRAFLKGGTFYCTEYEGPGESVAALLALGMGRVPCISIPETGATWEDACSSIPFSPHGTRWLHELMDPFMGPALAHYRYAFTSEATDTGLGVECRMLTDQASSSPVPREVRVTLVPGKLAVHVEARLANDRCLSGELVQYLVQSPTA